MSSGGNSSHPQSSIEGNIIRQVMSPSYSTVGLFDSLGELDSLDNSFDSTPKATKPNTTSHQLVVAKAMNVYMRSNSCARKRLHL